MGQTDDLADWLAEALTPLGTLTRRRMMGGQTLYLDGIVFAILHEGELWFKADSASDATWDAAGCPRFTYAMGAGKTGSMNYRRAPEAVYDDADALCHWAGLACAAGHRAPPKKPRRKQP
jgi:DNA transformation protein and related proteins